ncbi:pyridoxamine 5'-phosphate oxidase family protein [Phytoactinopolyspora halotolerans]|uniref:Pyridoxamine 5'-phosphate oxidase family protein n=1 Tax=Phytoactinopolyspora halotolerans TaxID=1981512 RepID=A0A6L9S2Z6_9ACTN|nr:pyridoxamine 5'-phosphate oxidase family protein [Phytoactinopolyspora halotolerans]
MTSDDETRKAVQAASVAELAWLGPAGQPGARPVTPLWLDTAPAVAYTYAEHELARTLAAASRVCLVLSDTRMAGSHWRPLALSGRFRLVEDRSGELFVDRLLAQELRKYPPSRTYADSPLLRREHWWFLPRLILVLEVMDATPVAARADGTGHVLAVAPRQANHTGLMVDTVRVGDDDPEAADGAEVAGHGLVHTSTPAEQGRPGILRIVSLAGNALPDGPATLLGHDFSVPDLERWTPWLTRGAMIHDALHVEEWPHRTSLEASPGVWRRFQRHRRLERACRTGLTD